jgi:hypothetical protein
MLCKAQSGTIDYDALEWLIYPEIGALQKLLTLTYMMSGDQVRAFPGSNLHRVLPVPVVLRTCLSVILSWH